MVRPWAVLVALPAILLAGCATPDGMSPDADDGTSSPSTAPQTTGADGDPSPLAITVEAWRDDMPGPGPREHPTRVTVRLEGEGHAAATLGAVTVQPPDGEPWTSPMTREPAEPGATFWRSEDGPEWPTGTRLHISFDYQDPEERSWSGDVELQSAV